MNDLHWIYVQEGENFTFDIQEWQKWLMWVGYWLDGIIDGEDEKTVKCIKDGIELLGENLKSIS